MLNTSNTCPLPTMSTTISTCPAAVAAPPKVVLIPSVQEIEKTVRSTLDTTVSAVGTAINKVLQKGSNFIDRIPLDGGQVCYPNTDFCVDVPSILPKNVLDKLSSDPASKCVLKKQKHGCWGRYCVIDEGCWCGVERQQYKLRGIEIHNFENVQVDFLNVEEFNMRNIPNILLGDWSWSIDALINGQVSLDQVKVKARTVQGDLQLKGYIPMFCNASLKLDASPEATITATGNVSTNGFKEPTVSVSACRTNPMNSSCDYDCGKPGVSVHVPQLKFEFSNVKLDDIVPHIHELKIKEALSQTVVNAYCASQFWCSPLLIAGTITGYWPNFANVFVDVVGPISKSLVLNMEKLNTDLPTYLMNAFAASEIEKAIAAETDEITGVCAQRTIKNQKKCEKEGYQWTQKCFSIE